MIIIIFCLQWKEFQENVRHSYKEVKHESIHRQGEGISFPCHIHAKIDFLFQVRRTGEFSDVTLACEDGQQIRAHKVSVQCSINPHRAIIPNPMQHFMLHVIYCHNKHFQVILSASSTFFRDLLSGNDHPQPLLLRGLKVYLRSLVEKVTQFSSPLSIKVAMVALFFHATFRFIVPLLGIRSDISDRLHLPRGGGGQNDTLPCIYIFYLFLDGEEHFFSNSLTLHFRWKRTACTTSSPSVRS